MENKEVIFVKGMMWKDPSEKAPAWIKGKILVKTTEFVEFIKDNQQYISEKGWLSIDIKESKKTGGLYMSLDTYQVPPKNHEEAPVDTITSAGYDGEQIDLNDIPF